MLHGPEPREGKDILRGHQIHLGQPSLIGLCIGIRFEEERNAPIGSLRHKGLRGNTLYYLLASQHVANSHSLKVQIAWDIGCYYPEQPSRRIALEPCEADTNLHIRVGG